MLPQKPNAAAQVACGVQNQVIGFT